MKLKILVLNKTLISSFSFHQTYEEPLQNILQTDLERIEQLECYYPLNTKKVKADIKKDWISNQQTYFNFFDVILCSDGDYFKTLAGTSKAEGTSGILYDSKYTSAKIMYVPSSSACIFHPDKNKPKLEFAFQKLKEYSQGQYQETGTGIIHYYEHWNIVDEIEKGLKKLHQYPILAFDIETKALRFTEAGIYTIAFAWDEHNYCAFPVDAIGNNYIIVRQLLKEFFQTYQGKLIVHKGNFDITVCNYVLFQNEDIDDITNQVKGLNCFFGSDNQRIEDTLLIVYLATNSTAGNTLGLKERASEFAGDWAVDVSDVTKVPLDTLLTYNGIDVLSTWFVYKKYYPMMVQDNQEELYRTFMLPTLKANIRCQLNGLPINPKLVLDLEKSLQVEALDLETKLVNYKAIQDAQWLLAEELTEKRNAKLKTKKTLVHENLHPFNFGSPKQLQVLLFSVMGLPIIEKTATKEPAVGKKVLKNLINHTENQDYKDILQALCDLADVSKILNAFIPAFKNAYSKDPNKLSYLIGNFNLGGTVSGRLSSSDPNIQNLPATGSRFAKPVKKLFQSTDEWIYCGIDFNALEARIDALTTKDPLKLKVFTEGWDVHCLNASIAFGKYMKDIDFNSKDSVNSIKDLYNPYRQKAKNYGFCLQYGGTEIALVKQVGLTIEEAKEAYKNYHETYKVSLAWKQEHIKFACENGYIVTGFGLRVRTPILKNTVYSEDMSNLAAAEARTAGNALGQGWGVLNDRAMNEVLDEVDRLGLTNDILPVGKIHDACYYKVRNDIDTILKLNELTTKAARWQNHPVIAHDEVHLSGQLDLFYPDWSNPITLPEECTREQLIDIVQEALSNK